MKENLAESNAIALEKLAEQVEILESPYGAILYDTSQDTSEIDTIIRKVEKYRDELLNLPLTLDTNGEPALLVEMPEQTQNTIDEILKSMWQVKRLLEKLSIQIHEQAREICPERYADEHACYGSTCLYCY